MSDPVADRYAKTEPLFPEWAAPIYLGLSIACAVIYLGLDMVTVSMPGLALTKALGIVMLGVFAGLKRAPMLAIALFLSAGGDYALAMAPPRLEAGIVFFGLAHISYIAIFVMMIVTTGVHRAGLTLAGALCVYGAAMWAWLSPGMDELIVPASLYLGIIVIMAMMAGLVKGPRLILTGALLFVLSDSVLAAGWFTNALRVENGLDWPGALVWVSYYGAQFCLALGIIRAKGVKVSPIETEPV